MSNLLDAYGNPLISEQPPASAEPQKPDPHARQIMPAYKQVIVIAPSGSSGVVLSDADGVLQFAIRPARDFRWPVQLNDQQLALAFKLAPGVNAFVLQSNLQGPPLDHLFVPSTEDPKKCQLCDVVPEERWVLTVQKRNEQPKTITFSLDEAGESGAYAGRQAAVDADCEVVVLRKMMCRVAPEGVPDA